MLPLPNILLQKDGIEECVAVRLVVFSCITVFHDTLNIFPDDIKFQIYFGPNTIRMKYCVRIGIGYNGNRTFVSFR